MSIQDEFNKLNKALKAEEAKIPDKVIALQKKIVIEALRRVVFKSPVDTGRARGGWQVSIGVPAGTKTGVLDKAGGETIQRGLAALSGLPKYQIVYVSNNVDYIKFLEYGSSRGPTKKLTSDGHSTQAPAGMVALTVEELRQMFQ